MFDRFSHKKQADKVFSVKADDGDSSDTLSWSGTPPDSPLAHKRAAPVTTIPETPPENLCKVSSSELERLQPCARNSSSFYGMRNPPTPLSSTSSSAKASASSSCSGSGSEIHSGLRGRLAFGAKSIDSDNATAPGSADCSLQVMQLVEMFPDLEQERLEAVLTSCGGDVETAVSHLLTENGTSPAPQVARHSKRSRRLLSAESDDDVAITSSVSAASSKRSRRLSSTDAGCQSVRSSPRQKRALSTESPVRQARGRRVYMALSDDEEPTAGNRAITVDDDDDDDNYGGNAWAGVKRAHVLQFLNSAKSQKLQTVMKPAFVKQVRSRRPFPSWEIMIEQLEEAKVPLERVIPKVNVLVEDILVMRTLMEKCDRVAKRLQGLVAGKDAASQLLPQPPNLNTSMTLSPYQRIGLTWMMQLYKEEVNGILADEMGLGKTVQAIAYLAQLMHQGAKGPFLIVVPSSTIGNWKREIALWCPDMDDGVLLYRGSQAQRMELQQDFHDNPDEYQVVLTSYSTCTGAMPDRKFLRHRNFTVCVLDEGHMLKNMVSQRYAYMSRICPERRLLLTGTPLQNNLTELLSLLHFTMPNIFSPTQECIRRLFSATTGKAATKADTNSELGSDDVDQLARSAHHIMQPFVLRRLKVDVLDNLPAKTHKVILCSMPKQQCDMYQKQLDHIRTSSCLALPSLMELRKLACHPLLCRGMYTDAALHTMAVKIYKENPSHYDVDKVEEDMTVMSDFELHNLCLKHGSLKGHELAQEHLLRSGKFQELDKLLPEFKAEGRRVLLFSQFVIMLNIVEVYMQIRGYRFIRLDGSTAVEERQELIDQYTNDSNIFVFLLSTKAGGLGINLTAADVAILHDIDLNPHNDRQAEDRCHRVGQTKPVTVIRLLSQHTVDEVMMRVAESKLKLEKDVTLSEKEAAGSEQDATSLLMEVVKK